MLERKMQIGTALVLAIALVGSAACRDEARPKTGAAAAPAGALSGGGASATASPGGPEAPRMSALKVGDGDGAQPVAQADPPAPTVLGNNSGLTQSSTGPGNRQSVNVRAAPKDVSVRQNGSGNTQILNVEATGGGITQRQSGSGNFQSMNIGVTDNPPVPPLPSKP